MPGDYLEGSNYHTLRMVRRMRVPPPTLTYLLLVYAKKIVWVVCLFGSFHLVVFWFRVWRKRMLLLLGVLCLW